MHKRGSIELVLALICYTTSIMPPKELTFLKIPKSIVENHNNKPQTWEASAICFQPSIFPSKPINVRE